MHLTGIVLGYNAIYINFFIIFVFTGKERANDIHHGPCTHFSNFWTSWNDTSVYKIKCM